MRAKRDPEYDRFGPWVIEISEEDPPPPLFLPYLTREETSLFSVKVPRQIERRVASPGMNLYDYMISLYQEDLVILQRDENNVISKTFFYRDIQHIRLKENLLKGTLLLSMVGNDYDLRFNTVSSEIMRHLVDLLRERYVNGVRATAVVPDLVFQEEVLSFYFTRLLHHERSHHPDFHVLASQIDTAVGAHETAAYRKIIFGIISKILLETLHLSDGRELKIISRGKAYKYRGQNVYATERCYIPITNISVVTWEDDPKNAAVINLILATAGGEIAYSFIKNNLTVPAYEQYLSDLMTKDIGRKVQMIEK